jgi:ABC-type bacteriocin/lantibiotic exporter with double-glycine peptidase domain
LKIGPSFIIGLSLFVICYYFDRHFHRKLSQEHHEQEKLKEKRLNLTTEAFENIKTIKFYGWDEYFKSQIHEFRTKEIENGQRISNIYLILHFVWNFLPNLMSSLSFIIFLSLGNNFSLPDVMEMLMLFEWIRGALHHALNMRQQIADLQICVRRV